MHEKELLAVVHAVKKWDHYLAHRRFVIRTYHRSLKFLLEQRITTSHQQKYIAKLLGYDFEITYKKGKDNTAADALSRVPAASLNALLVSTPISSLMPEIEASWETDLELKELIAKLKNEEQKQVGPYTWVGETLRRKGKIVIGNSVELKRKIMQLMHESAQGGHSGSLATTKRIGMNFYWKGLERCQKLCKGVLYLSDLQIRKCKISRAPTPLPILEGIWTHVSMDFIEGLPKSQGKEVIMVIVDRLSKYAHFISLKHPYTAATVATLYLNEVYKLHGCPTSIVSDRDPAFISSFWTELFPLQGVQLARSTVYHP